MGQIQILSDKFGIYKAGDTSNVGDFITEYLNTILEDTSLKDWLCRIPIPAAVDYIAKEWGIDYKFV